MEIIRATIHHLDELATLFNAYRVFYEQESDVEGAKAYLHQRLTLHDAVIFIAIDDNQKMLGFTQLYPTLCSVAMRPIWILYDLFVHHDARKQGVGRLLLERAKQHGIEHGAARLELSTAIDNTTAQSLYETMGWKRNERFYNYTLQLS